MQFLVCTHCNEPHKDLHLQKACITNSVMGPTQAIISFLLQIMPCQARDTSHALIKRDHRCRFVATNRELKRLDSLAMSPIFGMFSETLQGLTSVRAFRMQSRFQVNP